MFVSKIRQSEHLCYSQCSIGLFNTGSTDVAQSCGCQHRGRLGQTAATGGLLFQHPSECLPARFLLSNLQKNEKLELWMKRVKQAPRVLSKCRYRSGHPIMYLNCGSNVLYWIEKEEIWREVHRSVLKKSSDSFFLYVTLLHKGAIRCTTKRESASSCANWKFIMEEAYERSRLTDLQDKWCSVHKEWSVALFKNTKSEYHSRVCDNYTNVFVKNVMQNKAFAHTRVFTYWKLYSV